LLQTVKNKVYAMFRIDINLLTEHPQNQKIYGDDDQVQFNELVEKIKTTGWINPILISPECVILSGHRRYKAAIQLGWKEIDVDIVKGDEEKQLEVLLLSNAQRDKTVLQRLNEAALYKRIVEKKAAQRILEAGQQNLGQSPVSDSGRSWDATGKTSDLIGIQPPGKGLSPISAGIETRDRLVCTAGPCCRQTGSLFPQAGVSSWCALLVAPRPLRCCVQSRRRPTGC
jgi:ParB/RepB/Spo0J family partition protein